MICATCNTKPAEGNSDTCFRCRVAQLALLSWRRTSLRGANFSARTNAEYVAEHVGDVSRPEIAHVGSRGWQG